MNSTSNSNRDRLMKTVSAMVYFFVGPLQVAATMVLKFFLTNYVLIVGCYMNPLVYSASIVNFVTYSIFKRDYRRELELAENDQFENFNQITEKSVGVGIEFFT